MNKFEVEQEMSNDGRHVKLHYYHREHDIYFEFNVNEDPDSFFDILCKHKGHIVIFVSFNQKEFFDKCKEYDDFSKYMNEFVESYIKYCLFIDSNRFDEDEVMVIGDHIGSMGGYKQ